MDAEGNQDTVTAAVAINLLFANVAVICLAYLKYKEHNGPRPRRFWSRYIFRNRPNQGDFHHLVQEMRQGDRESFFGYFRMTPEQFDFILNKIEPKIRKNNTRLRQAISPAERLCVTLRFLAAGDSQRSISYGFRLGRSTVSNILRETCVAIWEALSPIVLKLPSNVSEWDKVCHGFETMWNLPNCLGALDGKHVLIDSPAKSGSKFYNYKGSFSIVLMALCDSHYRLTMVDIGAFGSQSDSGVFTQSNFGILYNATGNKLNIPAEKKLANSNLKLPCFIIGDDAFPLTENIMKPYPGRGLNYNRKVFNYRLSRARRVIENCFGIAAARWRILRKPIRGKPENIDAIIKACVVLHNYMMSTELGEPIHTKRYAPPAFADREDANGNIIPGQWRSEANENAFRDYHANAPNRHKKRAGEIRDKLAAYLVNEGRVPWQDAYVNRGNV